MSIIENLMESFEFNRTRTLGILESIKKAPSPEEILGFRPGPGRAHIAWQLMHIGITEEIFATERFQVKDERHFEDQWARFRGGSAVDDELPSIESIEETLNQSRLSFLKTLREFSDDQLPEVLEGLKDRDWSLLKALQVLSWHEAHHQGQAHLTFNIWKANQE